MRAYKHVSLAYSGAFAAGTSIQIATSTYYRSMEGTRGDILEGVAEYTVSKLEPYQAIGEDYRDARRLVGLTEDMSRIDHFIFRDNVVRYVLSPTYIFCLSKQPDRTLSDVAIFEVADLDLFAHRLKKAAKNFLGPYSVEPVIYEPRSINPFLGGSLHHGIFQKSYDFVHEQEVRIAWQTKEVGSDPMQINCPLAARLIKRIA